MSASLIDRHRLMRAASARPRATACAIAMAVAALAFTADRMRHVHSDDARVAADMVLVSSEIAGRIVRVDATDGERIDIGSRLLQLDDEAAQLEVRMLDARMAALEAELHRESARVTLVREAGASRVGARRSGVSASEAEIEAARAMLATAEAEHRRMAGLRAAGLAVEPALERARDRLEIARRTLALAQSSRSQRAAEVNEAMAESGEAKLAAASVEMIAHEIAAMGHQRARAALALSRHTIASPIAGVVDEVFVDAGEYVTPGARLALIHDPSQVWIEANIKETAIRRIRTGARVDIRLDAAPSRVVRGEVATIGEASTAQFALVPLANPSGVFTKITQRVPVRIAVTDPDDAAWRVHMRPGAMVRLKIRAHGAG